MAKQSPTFYVLHGEDEYSRKAMLRKMREDMHDPSGLNISEVDGGQVGAREVINMASAMPFLAEKRLVIVDGLLGLLAKRGNSGKAEFEVLVQHLPHLPPSARLVFHEHSTLPDKNPILRLIGEEPSGYVKAFNAPSNLSKWITQQAEQAYGVSIDPAAVRALAVVVEKDMRAADNELAKLAAYVDGERPISEADVALLTTYVAEPDIFAMVDAIGQQDGKTAMRICMELLANQQALALFGMINRQFRLLILAREYLDQNGSAGGMGKSIGVHDFVAKKLSQQAGAFRLPTLEGIYRKLVEYDYNIKMGKIADDVALQLFIAAVTR